jgi:hypothetical protein
VGGVAPSNTDSAIIATTGGNSVTLGAAATNAGLTVNAGATLNFSGAYVLTENGNVVVNGSVTGTTGTIRMSSNGRTISGSGTIGSIILASQNFSFLSDANLAINNTINSAGRTVTNNGTITLTGNYARTSGTAVWTQGTNAVLNISGVFTPSANVTLNASASGNTINYNDVTQAVEPATYYNLILDGGSGVKSMVTGTSVTGTLSIAPTGTATANISAGVTLTVANLTLGGLGRINGTWGSTSSSATYTNNTYFAATTGRLSVTNDTRATPTIFVTNSPITYDGSAHTAAVSGSVAGSASSVLLSGSPTQTNAGTYAVTANFTPTDGTSYKSLTAASAGSFVITQASQSITFSPLPDKTLIDPDFLVSATASSGLTVSFSSLTTGVCTVSVATVHLVNAGTCTIRASQSGSANYLPAANVDQSFTVGKINPTLSVTNSPVVYSGAPQAATVVGSVAGTVSNVKYSDSAVTPTNAGTYAITADFLPNDTTNYNSLTGASAGSFVITQASQTIDFSALFDKTLGDPDFNVFATASSGLTVSFSSLTTGICTLVSTLVHLVSVGECTIRASQLGNVNYLAAPDVDRSFFVNAVTNPVPTTTSLSPSSKTAGEGDFTLTVHGTGFISSSSILWNGASRATTYVSSGTATAAILASDIATASSSILVAVQNPPPGGSTSNPQVFTVAAAPTNPVPVIASISPNTVTEGSTGFTLIITGTDFVASSVAQVDGAARTTTFVSATELSIAIATSELASATTYDITVANPAPGGGTSNSKTLSVTAVPTNPVPHISSISPSTVTEGAAGFTLSVFGTDFVASSVVQVDGVPRATTFSSATKLLVDFLASELLSPATANIIVVNPAPGGGTSNTAVFTIASSGAPATPEAGPTGGPAGPSTITFTGHAFPGALVKVVGRNLSFDLLDTQNARVDADGSFTDTFTSAIEGVHSFALSVTDRDGRATQSKFFTFDTTSSHTFNVIVPPTVSVSPAIVRRGSNVAIYGFAPLGTVVHIDIDRAAQPVVVPESDGSYRLSVNTAAFDFGEHEVRVLHSSPSGRDTSDFALSQSFTVSSLVAPSADLNADGVIDITDMGMFFPRWVSTDASVRDSIDLNGDGKINLTDFSILVRAIRK